MIEIKFRVWDASIPTFAESMDGKQATGQMVNWEYVSESAYFLDSIKGEYPIMQYTGLKDKNGVEIYEGDILSGRKENKYFVVFENGAFYLYHTNAKDREENNLRWGLLSRLFDVDMKDLFPFFEVIGNIFENPELLEK